MHRRSTFVHRNLTGTEAERQLMEEGEDGSFLLRTSKSSPDSFSLSVRQNNKIIHIKILNRGDHFELNENEFATLGELAETYVKGLSMLQQADGSRLELKKPLYQTLPCTERWYHGRIDGPKAEEILLQQTHTNSFLVRDSNTKPGDFVLSAKTDDKTVTHLYINCRNGRFDIIEGTTFVTMTELIDHYRCHKIELQGGLTFTLTQAAIRSKLLACDIEKRIAELNKTFESENKHRNGFWEEFHYLEQLETGTLTSSPRTIGQLEPNRTKNRYKNILPFDDTRVILNVDRNPNEPSSDYINANHVYCMNDPKKKYIATQGCLDNTVADFWRMVWQENCRVVAMVTQVVEMGRNKCVPYWPTGLGESQTYATYGSLYVVKLINVFDLSDYRLHQLELYRESHVSKKAKQRPAPIRSEIRTIYHYQYLAWPDKQVPRNLQPILAYISDINCRQASENCSGPVVVHCSAGIGRSGALILIDIITSHIQKYGVKCEIDILQAVCELRRQRSGMVQTECQYQFAYMVVKQFVDNILKHQMGMYLTPAESTGTYQKLYVSLPEQTRFQQDLHNKPGTYVNLPQLI